MNLKNVINFCEIQKDADVSSHRGAYDTVIDFIESRTTELEVKDVVLPDVIKHRELLIDFYKSFYSDVGWLTHKEDAIEYVDKYMKSINS